MQPLSSERGSVPILAALSICILSAFAAGVTRVGEARTQGVELQNAVDAAALAIAEDCAAATCTPASATAIAEPLLDATAADGAAGLDAVDLDLAGRTVTVSASSLDGTGATATATAGWNAATHLDVCDYANLVTAETTGGVVLRFNAAGAHPNKPCPGPAGLGGNEHVHEWFDYASKAVLCVLTGAAFEDAPCTYEVMRTYIGQPLYLPLFTVRHNGKWDFTGFRPMTLTGFRVGTDWSYPPTAPPCTGTYRCISGVLGQTPAQAAGVRLMS